MITKYHVKSNRYLLSACEHHVQTKEKKYLLAARLESLDSNWCNDYQVSDKSNRYFLSDFERHAQTKKKKYSLATCLESFESNPFNN